MVNCGGGFGLAPEREALCLVIDDGMDHMCTAGARGFGGGATGGEGRGGGDEGRGGDDALPTVCGGDCDMCLGEDGEFLCDGGIGSQLVQLRLCTGTAALKTVMARFAFFGILHLSMKKLIACQRRPVAACARLEVQQHVVEVGNHGGPLVIRENILACTRRVFFEQLWIRVIRPQPFCNVRWI